MSEQVNVQVTVDTATAKCAANMEFIKQAANVIDDYDNIVTLAPVLNTVATDLNQGDNSTIRTVSGISDEVTTVAGLGSTMGTILTFENDIETVGSDLRSGDDSNILTTVTNMPKISTVVTNMPAISTVTTNMTSITNVSINMPKISTAATNMPSISTVATNIPAISTVTTNMTTITAVATDLASPSSDIKNAISAASTATTKATEASNSAHEASAKAQIATAKASNAASSATTASTAATAATSAMTTATTAATTATQKATEAVSSASTASTQATIATSAMTTATTAATTATSAMTTATTAATTATQAASTATAQANKAEQQAARAKRYADETHGASDVTVSNLRALPAINNYKYPQTDEDGLNDLIEEAHSTFDESKFTKNGTSEPIISENGIASNFNTNGDLLTNYTFNPSGSWKIIGSFETPSTLTSCSIIAVSDATYSSRVMIRSSGSNFALGFRLSSNNSSYFAEPIGANALSASTKYYFIWEFTGTEYTLKISTDKVNWQTTASSTSSSSIYTTSSSKLRIGKVNNSYEIFNGTIDLKQFSITVDGVPVFSGNQTGIDTIKSDNYTVVGTPTISADGIASGFSASNYINTRLTFNPSESVEYICGFKTGNDVSYSTSQTIWRLYNNLTGVWQTNAVRIQSGDIKFQIKDAVSLGYTCQANTQYFVYMKFTTAETYYAVYNENMQKLYDNTITTDVIVMKANNSLLTFGCLTNQSEALSGGYLTDGSIDLNAFKIYVDGNLVYQPCLKIPYTLSKTGSKIVDKSYRDRVNDMYEQFGYAPYFTLKEDGIRYAKPVFEKVGSPTLVNGVASNFSNDDYFTTILTFEGAWEFNCKFNVSEWDSNHSPIMLISTGTGNKHDFIIIDEKRIVSDGVQFIGSADFPSSDDYLKTNTNYLLTINYNGVDTYITTVKNLDNGTIAIRHTTTTTFTMKGGVNTWRIGASTADISNMPYFNGSIDLNSLNVKLETDYYQNFTVPQGNLYGMINPDGFDGEWVYSGALLSSATNRGTDQTVDLSSILPNDGFRYECIFYTIATRASASETPVINCSVWDDIAGQHAKTIYLDLNVPINADGEGSTVQYTGIVGARAFKISITSGALNSNSTHLLYYRRLGKNR